MVIVFNIKVKWNNLNSKIINNKVKVFRKYNILCCLLIDLNFKSLVYVYSGILVSCEEIRIIKFVGKFV